MEALERRCGKMIGVGSLLNGPYRLEFGVEVDICLPMTTFVVSFGTKAGPAAAGLELVALEEATGGFSDTLEAMRVMQ